MGKNINFWYKIVSIFQNNSTLLRFSSASIFMSITGMFSGLVIMRWIPPDEYGVWQSLLIIQSYAGIVQAGVVHGLNRELPFRLGAGDQDALVLASSAQTFSVFGAGLLTLAAGVSAFFFEDPKVRLALPAILLIAGISTYNNYLTVTFRADHSFDKLGKVYFGIAVLNVATLPLVLFLGFVGIPLRVLTISSLQMLAIHFSRPFRLPLHIRWSDIAELSRTGIPLFVFGYALAVAYTFPKTILLLEEGSVMVGLFAPAAALFAVVTLIPRSISQYIYAKMSFLYGQTQDGRKLWPFAWKSSLAVVAISLPVVLAAAYVFPWIVENFFPKYQESIPAMVWIALSSVFLSTPMYSSAMNSLKAWRWLTIFTIVRVTLSFAVPFLFYFLLAGSPLMRVSSGYFVAGLISFFVGLYCAFRATHEPYSMPSADQSVVNLQSRKQP